jgi:hypothetical protein
MKKRGIELTLNTIIVAALSLLVLVVLIIAFTGGFGDVFSRLRGLIGQGTAKADCIPNDIINDEDGDGYHDTNEFEVTCKGVKKMCKCDTDHSPNSANAKKVNIDAACVKC